MSRSKVFQLSRLQGFFGEGGYSELPSAMAVKPIGWLQKISFTEVHEEFLSSDVRNERENRLLNLIFAESFDSYFCRPFGSFDQSIVDTIKNRSRPVKDLNLLTNTRLTMRGFFNETFNVFDRNIVQALAEVDRLAKVDFSTTQASRVSPAKAAVQFALANNGYESPWWAGTQAFFGSVWDNTGGAAGRGYESYKKNVSNAVDSVYDGNIATTSAKAIAKVGSDSYSDYYKATAEKTQRRIDAMQQGGMTDTTSQIYGVALAAGDVTGFTPAAEAVAGADSETGRDLSAYERTQRGALGVAGIAGTASGVLAFQSSAATSLARSSLDDVGRVGISSVDDVARTGAAGTIDDATRAIGAACLVGPCDEFASRSAAFRQAKRDAGIDMSSQPSSVEHVPMTDRAQKPIFDSDFKPVETREYHFTNRTGDDIVIQDHGYGHRQFEGPAAEPHFNVRPAADTRHGTVPGTQEHYTFPSADGPL